MMIRLAQPAPMADARTCRRTLLVLRTWLTRSGHRPYYFSATDRAPFFGVRRLNADQPPFFFCREPLQCTSST